VDKLHRKNKQVWFASAVICRRLHFTTCFQFELLEKLQGELKDRRDGKNTARY
jgi:hypothetical protein